MRNMETFTIFTRFFFLERGGDGNYQVDKTDPEMWANTEHGQKEVLKHSYKFTSFICPTAGKFLNFQKWKFLQKKKKKNGINF